MPTQQSPEFLRANTSEELRTRWIWFLSLGVLLDLLGVAVLGSAFIVSMRFLGWLLVFSGILRAVYALCMNQRSGSFIELATALLYALAGLWVAMKPGSGDTIVTPTLAIAVLLMVDGVLHIAGSLMLRYPKWRGLLVDGILVLVLGVGLLAWQQFQTDFRVYRPFVIALFLGMTMLIHGGLLTALGWAGKRLREAPREGS